MVIKFNSRQILQLLQLTFVISKIFITILPKLFYINTKLNLEVSGDIDELKLVVLEVSTLYYLWCNFALYNIDRFNLLNFDSMLAI